MLPHFSRVSVVPHVVRRHRPQAADLAFAAALLGEDEGAFRFFSIVDSANPRKNLWGLLDAFASLRSRTRRKAALVLKQYRAAADCSGLPGVISIEADLTPGQMAALHTLCHAYVSAHHAEGWGLGLSEAMAYGKPVIATAWSGNMDFMDASNSLPVPYRLVPVSGLMCERIPLFRPDMRWAEIDGEALVRAMASALEGRLPPDLPVRAAGITRRFSRAAVGGIMQNLLEK
jgi:glycosyltransferase involved in cell wall biosynthesis